mgnify:CR=1 FL=1
MVIGTSCNSQREVDWDSNPPARQLYQDIYWCNSARVRRFGYSMFVFSFENVPNFVRPFCLKYQARFYFVCVVKCWECHPLPAKNSIMNPCFKIKQKVLKSFSECKSDVTNKMVLPANFKHPGPGGNWIKRAAGCLVGNLKKFETLKGDRLVCGPSFFWPLKKPC